MHSASTFSLPKRPSEKSKMPSVRRWEQHDGARDATKWMARSDGSMQALDRKKEEHLDAMRLLIPLAMIVILFVLWYAGMPLLPN